MPILHESRRAENGIALRVLSAYRMPAESPALQGCFQMQEMSKRRNLGVWFAVAMTLLVVAYPLSLYPVHWLILKHRLPFSATRIYKPIDWIATMTPRPVSNWWREHRFWSQIDCVLDDCATVPPSKPIGDGSLFRHNKYSLHQNSN